MVTLANNLPQRKTLESAARAVSAAGVEAILYKGQDYLDRIYGDVGARTMADVDLLIRPRDLRATRRALLDAGFHHVPDSRTHHEFKFVRDEVAVDVHTQLISGNRMRVDMAGLFARSLPSPVDGLRSLEATDATLVHCIAQTVKGYHVPASSYFELQWLLARADHRALRARAIAWRATACLYASMRALCDIGNRAAAMLVRRLPVAAPRRAALDQLVRCFSLHTSYAVAPPRAVLLLAKFALVDRTLDGLRFVSQWAAWQVAPSPVLRC